MLKLLLFMVICCGVWVSVWCQSSLALPSELASTLQELSYRDCRENLNSVSSPVRFDFDGESGSFKPRISTNVFFARSLCQQYALTTPQVVCSNYRQRVIIASGLGDYRDSYRYCLNPCDPDVSCIRDTNLRCICNPEDTAKKCLHTCDENAVCTKVRVNQFSGRTEYRCACKSPYRGNGIQCTLPLLYQNGVRPICNRRCGTFATCQLRRGSIVGGVCECNPGYAGNGITCLETGVTTTIRPATVRPTECGGQICHPNAICTRRNWFFGFRFQCACQSPYSGDGIRRCILSTPATNPPSAIGQNGSRDPSTVDPFQTPAPTTANPCGVQCHSFADCRFVRSFLYGSRYRCVCRFPYSGNGLSCR